MKYVKAILPESRGGLITFHEQEFSVTADKQLAHYTDGKLRATVPPEGWSAYVEAWPACAPVVKELRPAPEKRKKPRR